MHARQDDLTATLITLYTVRGVAIAHKKSNKNVREILWLITNPTGSICAVGASYASEWIYQVGSKCFGIDKMLQAVLLPPHRLISTLGVVTNGLQTVAYFTPNAIRPLFPVHILCKDAALLISKTKSTLSVGMKIKACITKTGVIAKETIVCDMSQQLKEKIEYKINQTPLPSFLAACLATAAQTTAEKSIDIGIAELNREIEKKEHDYLNKVSAIVTDKAAKKVMTICLSTGAAYFTTNYLIPNITKWSLSFFMNEAAAELITAGVKTLAIGATGIAIYSSICQYGADREENANNLSVPLNILQTEVIDGICHKVEQMLPSINNRFTLFSQNQFVTRCKEELPATFSLS